MKLTDIKKLKVPELRSRLKELGLDIKGLKAELVGRLWSALEAGQSGVDGEEEPELQNDTSRTPAAPTETVDARTQSSSPPTEAGVTARSELDRTRALTDSATQTETDTGLPAPQRGPELIPERVPEYQAEQGHAEGPREDRRAQSSEDMARGRAFYEFKEEIRYKRAKSPQPAVNREEAQEEDEVRLNPYDSHLHFEVGPDCGCGQPRFWARCPSLWSGCRLTHGVLQGRVGFEVRLERKLTTQLKEQEDRDPYGLRVGWSTADASLLLGEDEFSFAYDGRGKKVSGGMEEEFGEPFSEGDIIGCYASFSTDAAIELSFQKNGRFMGVAFSLDASVLPGCPLFPHVLCKSCSVRFQLDPTAPPWYPGPPGFTSLAALSAGQRVRSTSAPSSRAQCEVLLMVGLPGSGKSHWARTHMKQHPDKQYRLLGTEELLACMISGGQKDSRLQQASQCLTDLIKTAAQTPANYILDQCNILFSARRYKLQLFTGFRRRVVVVFPSADEWKRRLFQHQASDGEQIPETALLKLQVSCSLPEQQSDLLEELQYVELPQEQAQTLLQEYKDEARRLLPPVPKQDKKKPRLHKKRPHPHGPPPSRRMQWTALNGWTDARLNMQSWRQQQPRYWSVAYQDQGYYYRDFGDSGYEGHW
ncbi:heterogeneous nuclear ribonucleoprotein U-like protein 2 [Chaetodon trifascialis]|uniref:heterogeneous nuclear ribonucleoprotein U-like protein 2 n=1 Tax=Chaetodon trifascialis TaxID=109706 RepID=UPI0039946ABC